MDPEPERMPSRPSSAPPQPTDPADLKTIVTRKRAKTADEKEARHQQAVEDNDRALQKHGPDEVATDMPTPHFAPEGGLSVEGDQHPLVYECSCPVKARQSTPDDCVVCGRHVDAVMPERRAVFRHIGPDE